MIDGKNIRFTTLLTLQSERSPSLAMTVLSLPCHNDSHGKLSVNGAQNLGKITDQLRIQVLRGESSQVSLALKLDESSVEFSTSRGKFNFLFLLLFYGVHSKFSK